MTFTVRCLRNGLVESVHPVSAVAYEGAQLTWSAGPEVSTFWRSASKPFQLATSLSCLDAAVVASLDERMLAVGTASHSGQPEHVALVRELLARFGLGEDELQCGAHLPVHPASARSVERPLAVHNNCSGKHTFMLAACAAQGWARDYRPLEHPLQQRNQRRLDAACGVDHRAGIDGCSIPTFFGPLSGMARAWGRLACAMDDGADALLHRIGWAMQRQPFFVSGTERLDLAVTTQASEPLAVKVGAEGLFCIARPTRRSGIAVKVHSGNPEALAVAVKAVLEALGVALAGDWPWSRVLNVRERVVGERSVTLERRR